MKWSEPELVVVNMNAEIGGYQNDFDDEPRPYYGRASGAEAVSPPQGNAADERAK
jgi:hypothetical protein